MPTKKPIKRVSIGKDKTGYAILSPDQFGKHILTAIGKVLGKDFEKHMIMISFEGKRETDHAAIRNLVLSVVPHGPAGPIKAESIDPESIDPESFMEDLKNV